MIHNQERFKSAHASAGIADLVLVNTNVTEFTAWCADAVKLHALNLEGVTFTDVPNFGPALSIPVGKMQKHLRTIQRYYSVALCEFGADGRPSYTTFVVLPRTGTDAPPKANITVDSLF